jgi:hypothetical protein
VHAEHPEPAEVAGEVAGRDRRGLEPVGEMRADPVVAEPADGVAHGPLVVVEQPVEREQLVGGLRVRLGHGWSSGRRGCGSGRP